MAQIWQLGVIPTRPGTYFRVSSDSVTTVGALNGTVAAVFRSDWGPLNKVVAIAPNQMNNLREIFGTGAGVEAIKEALVGGATQVKAIRVGNSDGQGVRCWLYSPEGTISISNLALTDSDGSANILIGRFANVVENYTLTVKTTNYTLKATTDYTLTTATASDGKTYTSFKISLTTAGKKKLGENKKIYVKKTYKQTAVKAVRIYARYPGTRPLTCSIKTNILTGKRQFLVYDGTTLFDSVDFAAGGNEAQALCTALETNKNFKGVKYADGLLGDVTGRALGAGIQPTVNVQAYSAALDVLERHFWNVLIADSHSNSINLLFSEYIKQSYEMGHLGMTVLSGTSKQTFEERLNYAAALNDWRVVYLLGGWRDIAGNSYDGWKAAARIGGMIAACETNASLTHLTISNALELIEPFSIGEMIQAEEKGCFVLSLNDDDQVQIDNSINTLVTLGNDMDDGWKKIRRTKCRFELMTRINRTCDKLIGRLNNDSDGRATLIAAMNSIIREMIAEKKLYQGSNAQEDTRYKPAGDRAYFVLTIADIDSLEKIFLDYNFSYDNRFEE